MLIIKWLYSAWLGLSEHLWYGEPSWLLALVVMDRPAQRTMAHSLCNRLLKQWQSECQKIKYQWSGANRK